MRNNDIANGVGVRVTLFVSGCRNHCKNCFQPETWDFNYGKLFDGVAKSDLFNALSKPYIRGLTLLGGEPFEPENQIELVKLLRSVRNAFEDKDIWCYTGYTLEQLLSDGSKCRCEVTDRMLSLIDVLVDGKFIDELKDISLKFRGSSNQRIINMQKTLENGNLVLYEL